MTTNEQPSASALTDEQLTEILRKWSIKNKIFTLHYIWEDLKRDLLAALPAPVSEPIYQIRFPGVLTPWSDVSLDRYADCLNDKGYGQYWQRRIVYAAPPQAVVAQPMDADKRDAERYRIVRARAYRFGVSDPTPEEVDRAVDALAAQSPQAKAGDKHD